MSVVVDVDFGLDLDMDVELDLDLGLGHDLNVDLHQGLVLRLNVNLDLARFSFDDLVQPNFRIPNMPRAGQETYSIMKRSQTRADAAQSIGFLARMSKLQHPSVVLHRRLVTHLIYLSCSVVNDAASFGFCSLAQQILTLFAVWYLFLDS